MIKIVLNSSSLINPLYINLLYGPLRTTERNRLVRDRLRLTYRKESFLLYWRHPARTLVGC
jgi:hypothetical protein